MKFSIGYQLPDEDDSIWEIARDYREHLSGVYFALPAQPNARSAIDARAGEAMMEELRAISDLGLPLTLLYNANCYGGRAISGDFREEIARSVSRAMDRLDLREITTTSPFVAMVVKQRFATLKVCASVNMWIGTPQAMDQLGDDFDSFYLQREFNRDFDRLERVKRWCDDHGKQLKLLANSGCMYMCAFHTFHDNLVAHEAEAAALGNAFSPSPSPCWDYMRGRPADEAAASFLRSSWIHPRDAARYAPYCSEMKLATRMHSNPRRVVMAYALGRFHGNLLDLTEPSYAMRFAGHILDAERMPPDWFEHTTRCGHRCEHCGYCLEAARTMLVKKTDLMNMYCSG